MINYVVMLLHLYVCSSQGQGIVTDSTKWQLM